MINIEKHIAVVTIEKSRLESTENAFPAVYPGESDLFFDRCDLLASFATEAEAETWAQACNDIWKPVVLTGGYFKNKTSAYCYVQFAEYFMTVCNEDGVRIAGTESRLLSPWPDTAVAFGRHYHREGECWIYDGSTKQDYSQTRKPRKTKGEHNEYRTRRLAAGLTQQQVADEAHVNIKTVAGLESGRATFPAMVAAIEKVLKSRSV